MAEVLLGCGVDAESVDRFKKLKGQERAWAIVFSEKEILYNRSLSDSALGFCASFCCKEALYKAVRGPFSFSACEFFFDPAEGAQDLQLSSSFRDQLGTSRVSAHVLNPVAGELAVVVCVFGEGG